MADQNPSVTLIRRLQRRTEDGRLAWQESTSANAFLAAFADHSVEVSDLGSDYSPDYAVRILDDEGHLIEEITLHDVEILMNSGNLSLKLMRELFVAARRSARGADRVVKSILDSLGHDDDDESPFDP